jgi:S-adenosyl methyltransferase
MTGDLNWVPPDMDPNVPNPARVYDYWLDGAYNFAADRALAEKITKIMPGVREAARFNRGFLRRAALFMVESGIRQFLDIGSGLPTIGNLHETVQSVAPECRVVYVDWDPIAVAHSQLLVADNDQTDVVRADMRDVDGILDSPEVVRQLDLSQPVGLFMLLLLHFVPDSREPVGIVGRYRDRLASGSYLALSHVAGDSRLVGLTEAISAYQDTQHRPYPRDHDEVLRFFTGFELVEPGLVGCPLWRPDGMGGISDDPEINALPYAGVGRKP